MQNFSGASEKFEVTMKGPYTAGDTQASMDNMGRGCRAYEYANEPHVHRLILEPTRRLRFRVWYPTLKEVTRQLEFSTMTPCNIEDRRRDDVYWTQRGETTTWWPCYLDWVPGSGKVGHGRTGQGWEVGNLTETLVDGPANDKYKCAKKERNLANFRSTAENGFHLDGDEMERGVRLNPIQNHSSSLRFELLLRGATVVERLTCSPPTASNRLQFPAGSQDFRKWESCWTMSLVGEFSRGSPVSSALSVRRRSILTSITLIGSQDITVKSRPKLFTHLSYEPPVRPGQEWETGRNLGKPLHQASEIINTTAAALYTTAVALSCWAPHDSCCALTRTISTARREPQRAAPCTAVYSPVIDSRQSVRADSCPRWVGWQRMYGRSGECAESLRSRSGSRRRKDSTPAEHLHRGDTALYRLFTIHSTRLTHEESDGPMEIVILRKVEEYTTCVQIE
ncbi:hypothetical protein PR048_022018 [Dryococelus australis]|uniref:Uncharacterized protein n=1 Tax=Dryococelus australis TaxID=614101 RepID=A0ABQ9GZV0_9NEOP|nr:hypothetical protein PR048_022018 [Dryococelus australis]